jgi:hypothetical protein
MTQLGNSIWLHAGVFGAIRNHVGTPGRVDPWLAERLHDGRIPWKCDDPSVVDAHGFFAPDSEGKFPIEFDFQLDTASRLGITDNSGVDVLRGESMVIGLERVTLSGFAVSRSHIEAELGAAIESETAAFLRHIRSAFALLPSLLFFRGGRDVLAPVRGERQWIFEANPSLYYRGGKEVKRVQDLLKSLLDPLMQDRPVRKILRELEKRGIRDVTESGIQRALGRKV